MTRKNRFLFEEQQAIFSKEVRDVINEMELNGFEPPCCASPLNVEKAMDWCAAFSLCAIELGEMIQVLTSLFMLNEDISDNIDIFHPDTLADTPHSSSFMLYGISSSIEKAISKTIVELENITNEYLWLIEKLDNFQWKQLQKYSKNILTEDLYHIFKESISYISIQELDFIDIIQQTLMIELTEDWEGDALFVNEIIGNLLNNKNTPPKKKTQQKNNIISIKKR